MRTQLMTDKEALLHGLVAQKSRFTSGPTPERILSEIESRSGSIPTELRNFPKNFGGGYFGPFRIYPADPGENSSISLEDITNDVRGEAKNLKRHWVFAMDGAGNPFLVDDSNAVYFLDHETLAPERLCNSFREYMISALSNATLLSPAERTR